MNINGRYIEQVNKTKFLGVILDTVLNWEDHVNLVLTKVYPVLNKLRHIKHKLDRESCIMIYNSLIMPHFTYCIQVWGGNVSKKNMTNWQGYRNKQ
jgi:hypothetical protein